MQKIFPIPFYFIIKCHREQDGQRRLPVSADRINERVPLAL